MQATQEQISLAIRSRYPLLYLLSFEEQRVRRMLGELAEQLKKQTYFWTATRGFHAADGEGDGVVEPHEALRHIRQSSERAIFVLQDFQRYFDDPLVLRLTRDLAGELPRSFKSVLLLSPVLKLPAELEKDCTVIDIPLPDAAELKALLCRLMQEVGHNPKVQTQLAGDLQEQVVQAAHGLTEKEAERVFAKCVVNNLRFDANDLKLIVEEKRQIIRKTELLEYVELQEDLANVGGLLSVKQWLQDRRGAFSDKARAYGLPDPKGLLLLGVQGCGKSLAAKAIAAFWRLPLLRMDVGSVFSSFIGQSEANMRRALRIAESLAPCVLWLDELEKAFAGLHEHGGDGGTTKRVLASFLVWLQEKRQAVFVVATANSVTQLPPEFLRKGRFDEIFFVDLPDAAERAEIFDIHLRKRRREPANFGVKHLAGVTEGCSGAEIEQLIVAAMYRGFAQNREFTAADIEHEMRQSVPLSTTMADQISAQRVWAKTRARQAR